MTWALADQIAGPVVALAAVVGLCLQWRSTRRLRGQLRTARNRLLTLEGAPSAKPPGEA